MKYDALIEVNTCKAFLPQLSVWIPGTPHNKYLRRDKKKRKKQLDK